MNSTVWATLVKADDIEIGADMMGSLGVMTSEASAEAAAIAASRAAWSALLGRPRLANL